MDPGFRMEKYESGMKKFETVIWNNHPGSATLP
jgi:hypothetical protein